MHSFVCLNWLCLLACILTHLLKYIFGVGGLIELTGIHLFFFIHSDSFVFFCESIEHHCVIVALFNPFFHCAQLDFNRTSFIIFNWTCLCIKQTMPVATTAMTSIKKKVIFFPFHICLFNCLEYYFFRYIYVYDMVMIWERMKKNPLTHAFVLYKSACMCIDRTDFNSIFLLSWKRFHSLRVEYLLFFSDCQNETNFISSPFFYPFRVLWTNEYSTSHFYCLNCWLLSFDARVMKAIKNTWIGIKIMMKCAEIQALSSAVCHWV